MFNINVISSSNTLIEQACSNSRLRFKLRICIQILESHQQIISANNFYDLSIAIMQSGISSSTNTRTHVKNLLKEPTLGPNLKDALQDCKSAYNGIILAFNMALNEVRGKEYDGATYDLLIGSTDGFKRCLNDVAAGKIKDSMILSGNDVALIYAFSAYQAIDSITSKSQPRGQIN
ncbi:hypothetical protein PHJA_000836400 [Phtheirospermum japonicum]|uniref:Pectinesterase inhibitor domain-containing protein n=1 Tax=Phtheirospermum japonicum TaxID=374723 RepID=A0A830BJ97_9LAMI|nr:hypothetical protein PHJA_000836400 [Phtheirospermum japonicum]